MEKTEAIHCIVEDEDIGKGIDNSIISTKFHNTIILIIFDFANTVGLTKRLNKVVLSGGGYFRTVTCWKGLILSISEFEMNHRMATCPKCGCFPSVIHGGDDFSVVSLILE